MYSRNAHRDSGILYVRRELTVCLFCYSVDWLSLASVRSEPITSNAKVGTPEPTISVGSFDSIEATLRFLNHLGLSDLPATIGFKFVAVLLQEVNHRCAPSTGGGAEVPVLTVSGGMPSRTPQPSWMLVIRPCSALSDTFHQVADWGPLLVLGGVYNLLSRGDAYIVMVLTSVYWPRIERCYHSFLLMEVSLLF